MSPARVAAASTVVLLLERQLLTCTAVPPSVKSRSCYTSQAQCNIASTHIAKRAPTWHHGCSAAIQVEPHWQLFRYPGHSPPVRPKSLQHNCADNKCPAHSSTRKSTVRGMSSSIYSECMRIQKLRIRGPLLVCWFVGCLPSSRLPGYYSTPNHFTCIFTAITRMLPV